MTMVYSLCPNIIFSISATLFLNELAWYIYSENILFDKISLRNSMTKSSHPLNSEIADPKTRHFIKNVDKVNITKYICQSVEYPEFIKTWFQKTNDSKLNYSNDEDFKLKRDNIIELISGKYTYCMFMWMCACIVYQE